MAAAKKKPKIQARDIEVDNRTLESVLIDLAEQVKANDARCAARTERIDERCARAEEMAAIALQTVAAVTQDLRALTQELRVFAARTERRLDALEMQRSA